MKNSDLIPITHLSYSSIKTYLDSPQEFKYQYLEGNKKKSTKAMNLGSIVDCMLTTPDDFEKIYAVRGIEAPASSKQVAFVDDMVNTCLGGVQPIAPEIYAKHYSTKGKSEEAIEKEAKKLFDTISPYMEYLLNLRQNDLLEISNEVYEQALEMKRAIEAHPEAYQWLVQMPGINQYEFLWETDLSDFPIKGFMDKTIIDEENKRALIVDLKTTAAKNRWEFARMARRFKYHIQNWIYVNALREKLLKDTGENYEVSFIFVVVNSNSPHQVMVLVLDPDDLSKAQDDFTEAVEGIGDRLESGDWNDEPEIFTLKLFNENF